MLIDLSGIIPEHEGLFEWWVDVYEGDQKT
jgi:hypothetical protein